jgi:hypothetical protein
MRAPLRLSEEPRARALLRMVLLGGLILAGMGCATERQHLLERSAAHVSYSLPSEQILGVTRELLKERGYLILESRHPLYVRTSWRAKFDESLDIGASRERHLVMVKQLDDGRFVLNAYRLSYITIGRTAPHPTAPSNSDGTGAQRMAKGDPLSYAPPELDRDLELEWQILSRLSPAVARELESQVDQYLTTGSR